MDRQYQIDFRNAAAGLIKSLILARAVHEPEFLTPEEYESWGLSDPKKETRSGVYLLRQVKLLYNKFEIKYFSNRDSIPAPATAEHEDFIDSLLDRLAGFFLSDLTDLIQKASRSEKPNWDTVARWDQLSQMRNDLDKLPLPDQQEPMIEQASAETLRNLYFLKWYEDESDENTYHSEAEIRDRWNRLNPNQAINILTQDKGRSVVRKGIVAARKFLTDNAVNIQTAIDELEKKKS